MCSAGARIPGEPQKKTWCLLTKPGWQVQFGKKAPKKVLGRFQRGKHYPGVRATRILVLAPLIADLWLGDVGWALL